MTELKTLKDMGNKFRDLEKFMSTQIVEKAFRDKGIEFKLTPIGDVTFSMKQLKQEAIKWIKEIRIAEENKGYDAPIINKLAVGCDEYGCDNVENWIKHFFNITEEDLK